MKELVVISGKGGTGKTSIVASFAVLAEKVVLADCDVDAADLHLVMEPTVQQQEDFSGGKRAKISQEICTSCGKCMELCRFGAIHMDTLRNGSSIQTSYRIDPIACEGCGVCAWFCPAEAIEFNDVVNGQWFVSSTRCGPMVHARLGIAEENSGKLVSTVRTHAKQQAEQHAIDLVLVDGSPGIGCPVVASITGADAVLIVTEPTVSGLHDLGRVAAVAAHFGIPAMVCVNKWDLNEQVTEQIEQQARQRGLQLAGRVRYDNAATKAQISRQAIVEYSNNGSSQDIAAVWSVVSDLLERI